MQVWHLYLYYCTSFIVLYRPLEYSCGSSCSIHIEQSSTDEESATVSASVDLVSPPPTSTGVLQLCIGPQNIFWKRPLIDKSAVSCIPWNRSLDPRKGGYLIQPNSYGEICCCCVTGICIVGMFLAIYHA